MYKIFAVLLGFLFIIVADTPLIASQKEYMAYGFIVGGIVTVVFFLDEILIETEQD